MSKFASGYSHPAAVADTSYPPPIVPIAMITSDAEKAAAYRAIARRYARSAKLARKAELAQYRANSAKVRAETEANLIRERIAKY